MSLNTIGKEALEIYFMATNIIYTFQLHKKILKKMQKREKKRTQRKTQEYSMQKRKNINYKIDYTYIRGTRSNVTTREKKNPLPMATDSVEPTSIMRWKGLCLTIIYSHTYSRSTSRTHRL